MQKCYVISSTWREYACAETFRSGLSVKSLLLTCFPPPPPPTVANHNTKTVFRYIDVLGDPQSHSEAVIREFEAL